MHNKVKGTHIYEPSQIFGAKNGITMKTKFISRSIKCDISVQMLWKCYTRIAASMCIGISSFERINPTGYKVKGKISILAVGKFCSKRFIPRGSPLKVVCYLQDDLYPKYYNEKNCHGMVFPNGEVDFYTP
jgi:hypothetical protein